ncbi:uncharacterized protein SPPG_05790 [Spizellomyces punctatus DAOM BR117]|uniref:Chitin-binding type-4 domain-containing protein n=1 Tax=Spizellomyces punctatus (strain DAOM BR117) TaxID=645134 RepID=A0A0L0HDJ1_SPIPD|nr:uncharacterized protein SPPG_05790 [Spizellomyces punctatus DAOM BR117]KNC98813.1 hypothetical protein SPPG_05790 [Spizellomyces punctatus DAOM BR117]|eukprot:XP_016606853.1 hypothetical protein SPPG_05790 [Spizellomyces punctatus DAOM BR117]
MKSILSVAALAATFISTVAGHGFLVGPGVIGAGERGTVRNYGAINIDIDSLRSPTPGNSTFCRNAPPGPIVPITLTNGEPFTVTLAMSTGAAHIGPCSIEIIDPANPAPGTGAVIVNLWQAQGCAVPPINQHSTGDVKAAASSACPGDIPAGLITDDMCLSTWTFTVENADKITCKRCILRWYWEGWHLGVTNPEHYENCVDVEVTVGGGSGAGTPATLPASTGSTAAPAPAPTGSVPAPSSTATSTAEAAPVPTTTAAARLVRRARRAGTGLKLK